jgi:hypothetical protein
VRGARGRKRDVSLRLRASGFPCRRGMCFGPWVKFDPDNCDSYLRELEGRQSVALTPGSISTPRARRQSQLSQETSGGRDISPPGFAAPRRPSPVHERPREEAHHTCKFDRRIERQVHGTDKSAALSRLADSALGSDEPHGIESPFRLNPLADNDYTFAKMAGRYCKHIHPLPLASLANTSQGTWVPPPPGPSAAACSPSSANACQHQATSPTPST